MLYVVGQMSSSKVSKKKLSGKKIKVMGDGMAMKKSFTHTRAHDVV